jgi:cereblon
MWSEPLLREVPSLRPKTRPRERPARRPDRARVLPRQRKVILCRRCGGELSEAAAVFSMTPSGPAGVFVNPHGFLHEVLTVRRAKNLLRLGLPTTEFTWYPGYAWEIALCAGCREHVGWAFTTVGEGDPPSFVGLRRNAIVEEG